MAYDTLARRSDLVAMDVVDLTAEADGHGTVTIRRGKTDQEGRSIRSALALGIKPLGCKTAQMSVLCRKGTPGTYSKNGLYCTDLGS